MGKSLAPDKKALVKRCLDDGWSQIEIYRTHHVHTRTIRKYFPGKGMTPSEGGKVGNARMRSGVKL